MAQGPGAGEVRGSRSALPCQAPGADARVIADGRTHVLRTCVCSFQAEDSGPSSSAQFELIIHFNFMNY